GSRQTVFGPGRASLKRFGAIDIAGVFQLAGVDAEIAVGCLDRMLQLVESERFVCGQGADDSQAQTLVNQPIDFMRAVRSAALHPAEFFLLIVSLYFAPERSLFSHRTSSR